MAVERVDRAWVMEYWNWVAVALFLLLTVDTLTTLYAAAAVGVGNEANPLVRWALEVGPEAVVTLNIVAALVAVTFFRGLLATVWHTPARYQRPYTRVLEAFVGLLVAAGLFVFANNLAVVVLGRSLL